MMIAFGVSGRTLARDALHNWEGIPSQMLNPTFVPGWVALHPQPTCVRAQGRAVAVSNNLLRHLINHVNLILG